MNFVKTIALAASLTAILLGGNTHAGGGGCPAGNPNGGEVQHEKSRQ